MRTAVLVLSLVVGLVLGSYSIGCATSNPPVAPASTTASAKLTPPDENEVRIESGTIDKEAIRQTIRDNRRDIQKCYNAALKRNKSARGKMEIDWEYSSQGHVTNASVSLNQTRDDEWGQCVKRVIEKIKFPEAPKGQVVRVVFPFVFESTGELSK